MTDAERMERPYAGIAVAGPTASGKTGLAIALARALGGEIVSCDSMQVYRGMDIGTAKATAEERARVPHHLLDILDLDEEYSASDYAADAAETAEDILSRGRLPVFCGGTGLYLDAVMRGAYAKEAGTDEVLRRELRAFAEENGNAALHDRLRTIDPISAEAIHPNNVKRVIRAIEIASRAGKSKSELDADNREYRGLPLYVICLDFSDRELLYRAISDRVDVMLETGLCEEARRLFSDPAFLGNTTAAQAIGYKELFPYLSGRASLSECREALITATRRYAKRQLTWFRHKPYCHFLLCDEMGERKPADRLAEEAMTLLHENGLV